jgi:hypothetical protein
MVKNGILNGLMIKSIAKAAVFECYYLMCCFQDQYPFIIQDDQDFAASFNYNR